MKGSTVEFEVTFTGTRPLLMHNADLSNPLHPMAKALKQVTRKRTKTDDDHEEIARLEHAGGLYMDSDVGPYIPGQNIMRALVDGAKMHKLGTALTRGMFIASDVNPLAYKGPRTVDGLWKDENFRHLSSVKVGTARTMRCRPVFPIGWKCSARGTIDTNIVGLDELRQVADSSGNFVGLGDWRPRFGRFTVNVEKL